jgi:hypothetical protein
LEHLHLLVAENQLVAELRDSLLELEDPDPVTDHEQDSTSNSYCDEPGCQRLFAHSHISNTTTSLQFKVGVAGDGTEVFGKNYLSKV